jgi:hypothetical protein
MISIEQLCNHMAAPAIELDFVDGARLIVQIISVDETDPVPIYYKVLHVLKSGDTADVPGSFVAVAASAIESWRVYDGRVPDP